MSKLFACIVLSMAIVLAGRPAWSAEDDGTAQKPAPAAAAKEPQPSNAGPVITQHAMTVGGQRIV